VKRVALTAALVAAVAVWGLGLPPGRTPLSVDWSDGSVRGLLHVHSRTSDGRGTLDEIAAAAARAGLRFVVVTDHGDGSRRPEPPAYRSGVLVIDAVEISTRGGHYVALGLPRTPFPLGGDPSDVVDDVRRFGGFGVAAHPDSPKSELQWADWSAPIDGLELINPDTSWRVHAFTGRAWSRWLLLKTLLAYPVRPVESVAQLLTESAQLRTRWMSLAAEREVVALAGADAHAKLAIRDTEPGDNRFSVPIPSYESSFDSLSVHVTPATPFSGEADRDAAGLIDALRRGRLYLAVDGWATPPSFTFTATAAGVSASHGETLVSPGPLTLHVRSNAPAGYETVVWRGDEAVTRRSESAFDVEVGSGPGVYWVEVLRPNSDGMPAWVTSNPIYVRETAPMPSLAPSVLPSDVRPLFDGSTTAGWSYESDRTSLAVVDVAPLAGGARLRLRYGLSGGTAIGQYAAAAVSTPDGVAGAEGVAFRIRSEAPMRLSVQVRAEVTGSAPERWERSVFVEPTEGDRFVRFDRMTPVGATHATTPPPGSVRSIMFVVDTTNTKPGASGRLWLGNVRLAGSR